MKSLICFGLIALSCLAASPALSSGEDATVYVLHAIPGQDINALLDLQGEDALPPWLPVDVAVNDGCTLEAFTYGQLIGPLSLPAATYNIKISVADTETPCSNDAVIEADVPFEQGETALVVAHLTEDGAPTATKLNLDQSAAYRSKSRITLAHLAAAPTVDIELRRKIFRRIARTLDGVSNGDSADLELWAGYWQASGFPEGSNDVVLGPETLKVGYSKSCLVVAAGSLAEETLTLLVYKSDLEPGAQFEPVLVPEFESTEASVTVIHGIPGAEGLPVDISLNGGCVPDLEGFTFGTITDSIPLPAGIYDLQIHLADKANPCTGDLAVDAPGVELFGGDNVTIIAHLDAADIPTASVFSNELDRDVPHYATALVVHHTAAAPAVDVKFKRPWSRRARKIKELENGEQAIRILLAGRRTVQVCPAGSSDPVIGPVDLDLKIGTACFVYAVGSLADETLTVLKTEFPIP